MTGPIFVDSNVLIYAVDDGDPKKRDSARLWRDELWKSRLGRISFQVLHEFYASVVRKSLAAEEQARAEVQNLFSWRPIASNEANLQSAWKIQDRYKLSFWDAMIVAAAKAASCRYLLTEDLQAGQDLDGVLVVNPFRSSPQEIPQE